MKVPFLVEHFIDHRDENKNITLYQFLYVHYAMGDVRDGDYDKDMKLPFKSHDNCVANGLTVYPPSQKISIARSVPLLEKKHLLVREHFLQSSFLANIWQPPRLS